MLGTYAWSAAEYPGQPIELGSDNQPRLTIVDQVPTGPGRTVTGRQRHSGFRTDEGGAHNDFVDAVQLKGI